MRRLAKMRTIILQFVPHRDQRYNTIGDWFKSESNLHYISISRMCDWRYMLLVAVHELIEWAICKHQGVSEKTVDRWDFAHPDSDDPGSLPGCPYGEAHQFATKVEWLFSKQLGVNWEAYELEIERVSATWGKK